MKIFKFISFNLILFVTLIAFLDLGSLAILKYFSDGDLQKNISEDIIRHCYDDVDWAAKLFEEEQKVKAKYKAFTGWRRTHFVGDEINIDSTGIRKTQQSSSCKEDSSTIIFLGGSTIWGTGTNDPNTIPSLYANASKNEYPILNFGETGYTAFQSFSFLQLQLLQGLKAKTIISYDGVNNSPAHTKTIYSHSREDQIVNALKGADSKKDYIPFTDHILKPTRIVISKISNKFSNKASQEVPSFSEDRNIAAANELLGTWLIMLQLANSKEIDFYCVLQPNAYYGKPSVEYLIDSINNHRYSKGYAYYDQVKKLINTEKYVDLIPHFIDLTEVLDNVSTVYIDFCHLNHRGNKIIANEILNEVEIRSKKLSQ